MSSAGRAANSSGCVARPRAREIGLIGFAAQIRRSSLTGSYVMETAEHREPCESRGSRTVLGAPGGEIPPGDSTKAAGSAESAGLPMSAVPPIATESQRRSEPSRSARKRHPRSLFDHLVGAGEEGFRNRETDRFRGFEVDDQLELGRLLNGQITRLLTFDL